MNYILHYEKLIKRAKDRKIEGYVESHHIIPKCMNGSDDKDNLVNLTAREHFVAHILLVKIYPKEYGLIKAVQMMTIGQEERKIHNRMYGWLKEKFSKSMSETQKGKKNSQFGKIWVYNLQEKISKKINKEDFTTYKKLGWIKGRKINFDNKMKICKNCGQEFILKTKEDFCSDACRKHNKLNISEEEKEIKFINLYRLYKSKNRALKEMGYTGNAGAHSKWANKVIEKY